MRSKRQPENKVLYKNQVIITRKASGVRVYGPGFLANEPIADDGVASSLLIGRQPSGFVRAIPTREFICAPDRSETLYQRLGWRRLFKFINSPASLEYARLARHFATLRKKRATLAQSLQVTCRPEQDSEESKPARSPHKTAYSKRTKHALIMQRYVRLDKALASAAFLNNATGGAYIEYKAEQVSFRGGIMIMAMIRERKRGG